MRNGSVEHCYSVPEPGNREVGTHEKRTKPDRPQVGQNVFNGVGID